MVAASLLQQLACRLVWVSLQALGMAQQRYLHPLPLVVAEALAETSGHQVALAAWGSPGSQDRQVLWCGLHLVSMVSVLGRID